MIVGIVGLGLIGGSFAKAYKEKGHTVYAWNRSHSTLEFAMLSDIADGELTPDNIGSCDLVLLCLYPEASVNYLASAAPKIGTKPVVIDCCGTKRVIFEGCSKLSQEYGFTYVGGHPMAGSQYSGLKYAKANLYKGAPMVIVPQNRNDIVLLSKVKDLLEPAEFGHITVTSAEEHDRMIAFTSQMAHVVSNAYIKSPTAGSHKGFSAGSYRDMTRVAWLNPEMWAELFLENKDNLLNEINIFINNMKEYKTALENDDREMLIRILEEGKRRKEEVDGK